jgi:hypothetical protein
VFGINRLSNVRRLLTSLLLAAILSWGLGGCGDRPRTVELSPDSDKPTRLAGRVAEVSPPETLQELRQALERYQPQVKILSPRPDQVLQDDRVSVRLQVQDLPIFQNKEFELGPHLHVILDNQPYQAVYDTREPLVLEDLAPGTHTLRVFASRPWHESFKNEGAYAQTTFHLFTKTPENNPDPTQPLLTYSRPKGDYGAEPIMLDFYLTNAPLHLIAQENPEDEILDWRIRCTINGESFIFDRWQPIYLKGLKPGKNWVQLELLDEKGEPFPNPFNNTVRLINYEPNGKDTLSKLVRGELSADAVRSIVDPNYVPAPPAPEPIPEPAPVPAPEPTVEPSIPSRAEEAEPEEIPATEEAPTVEEVPEVEEIPQTEEAPVGKEQLTEPTVERGFEDLDPVPSETESEVEKAPVPIPGELTRSQPSPKGFFDRFRRRAPQPVPVPVAPAPPTAPVAPTPLPSIPNVQAPDAVDIAPEVSPEPPEEEPLPQVEEPVEVPEPERSQPASPKNFFDRFRRRAPEPVPVPVAPVIPEVLEEPDTADVVPEVPEAKETEAKAPEAQPQPEEPVEVPALTVPTVETLPEATPEEVPRAIAPTFPKATQPETTQPQFPQLGNFFDRFRRRSSLSPTPLKPEDTLPEIIETPPSEITKSEVSEPDLLDVSPEVSQPEPSLEEQTQEMN